MKALGHEVSIIHGGDMQTKERDAVMQKFRVGKNRILITTNLLSRGMSLILAASFDVLLLFILACDFICDFLRLISLYFLPVHFILFYFILFQFILVHCVRVLTHCQVLMC
jgi:hypothetical protein